MTRAQILREVLELPIEERRALATTLQGLLMPQHPQQEAPSHRWAALARRLENEGFLDGISEEAQELLSECRLEF
jgi:hypothetical protein